MSVQAITISTHGLDSNFLLASSPSDMSPSFGSAGSLTSSSSFATTLSEASSSSPPPTVDDLSVVAQEGEEETAAAAAAVAEAAKKHKPHKCDVCGASFARKVHLQRHSLRHQVCKPYCCERCGKCFSRQDSLVRHHRLLHEGGREANQKMKLAAKKKDNAGASSSSSALNRKRSRQRHDSVATTMSSLTSEEDEESDSNSWSLNGHGFRRDTASSVASSVATLNDFTSPVSAAFSSLDMGAMQQQQSQQMPIVYQPNNFELQQHPFEFSSFTQPTNELKSMPSHSANDNGLLQATAINMPHLMSLLPSVPAQAHAWTSFGDSSPSFVGGEQHAMQHANEQQAAAHEQLADVAAMPMFDWTALVMQQQLQLQSNEHHETSSMKQPFSYAASNKALNATLLSDDCHSAFPSPSVHGPMPSHMTSASDVINSMSHLGLHIAFPSHQTATNGGLAMSTDNWDGLMHSFPSHAMNRSANESLVA